MASAFAHIVIPTVVYVSLKSDAVSIRLFFLAAVLSVLPDVDVIGFWYDIPYSSQWGHRGFTHSFVFAGFISILFVPFKKQLRSHPLAIFFVCFIACASHSILDAMTNGGRGVAFFWPFSTERFFFPYRPIEVSPIGISEFFTKRGFDVISSELIWVFLPGSIFLLIGVIIRRLFFTQKGQGENF